MGRFNHQKIGDYPNMFGDDPTSSNYHLDLTLNQVVNIFGLEIDTHYRPKLQKNFLVIKKAYNGYLRKQNIDMQDASL